MSNGLAFSGMSDYTFASSEHFFVLTNLYVVFQSFFLSFLAAGSIFKTSPSTWTGASGVKSWWPSSLLSRIGPSAMYSVSESS